MFRMLRMVVDLGKERSTQITQTSCKLRNNFIRSLYKGHSFFAAKMGNNSDDFCIYMDKV